MSIHGFHYTYNFIVITVSCSSPAIVPSPRGPVMPVSDVISYCKLYTASVITIISSMLDCCTLLYCVSNITPNSATRVCVCV